MKLWQKILLIIGIMVIVCLVAFDAVSKKQEAPTDFLPSTALLGTTTISLELARTGAEQIRGLSDRTSLPQDKGLLFMFRESSKIGIWMKDMHFPIDVLWMDENFKIVTIVSDMKPESYPQAYYPSVPAKYVLETNSGVAAESGVKEGDVIKFNN